MDELLAVLGYKVKCSDMADVAQKLEQLEEAMVNVQGSTSQLSSETVHYNPICTLPYSVLTVCKAGGPSQEYVGCDAEWMRLILI